MKTWLKSFYEDERGLEALQVVLIVAIAAIILALIKTLWPQISEWVTNSVTTIMQFGQGN